MAMVLPARACGARADRDPGRAGRDRRAVPGPVVVLDAGERAARAVLAGGRADLRLGQRVHGLGVVRASPAPLSRSRVATLEIVPAALADDGDRDRTPSWRRPRAFRCCR